MTKIDSKIPEGPVAEKWTNYKAHQKLVNPANKRRLDIIVVGTGLAGASAAASLGEMGFRVFNFCIQDSPRRAHSIAAQGGINAAKNASTEVEGMGYAIPVSTASPIFEDLMNRQTREKVDESEKGYLGISCATVSSDVSEAYGIPEGVLVTDVASKSAAEKAGIKANYVITKIDGQSISSAEELTEKLNYYAVGETVPITYEYLKDDAYVEKTVDVTLMENPNANNK